MESLLGGRDLEARVIVNMKEEVGSTHYVKIIPIHKLELKRTDSLIDDHITFHLKL